MPHLTNCFSIFIENIVVVVVTHFAHSTGPVMMRNFVRKNKHDALVREVNLTEASSCFARIGLDDGREATISQNNLAPCPSRSHESNTLENQLCPINDKHVAELHDRAITDEPSMCEFETFDIVPDNSSENRMETTQWYEDQPG